ncbi:Uncharacterised protein [Streptococcus suis]|uniref:Uncharacterized protein n=1 Tax=Streptococcus suis TaxID=1307 RepID=A0A0Z8DHB4_STRSU|nr:Uncharacterised protein [Streptococcus suis]CYU95838.1 Uncharacterised protein [Streptococcus suis]CYV25919.1 Uncharacterised protein [Streptococcus suis]CYW71551.1 Uncharacterised protein [Streptococcus suis]
MGFRELRQTGERLLFILKIECQNFYYKYYSNRLNLTHIRVIIILTLRTARVRPKIWALFYVKFL